MASQHNNVGARQPEAPRFLQTLQGIVSVEGGSACFEALVTGHPRPEIHWYHGNEEVNNSINYDVTYTADGRVVLDIPEVFDEDAGSFTCQLINDHGQAASTAELVVQTSTIPPDFSMRLSNVEVRNGEAVTFTVQANGIPTPRVKWYREGAEIRSSNDFQIQCEGDLYSLTIAEAFEEDTGRFTVTASNQAGKATSTAILTVTGEGSVTSGRSREDDVMAQVTSRDMRAEMAAVDQSHEYDMQRTSFVERTTSRSSDKESRQQEVTSGKKAILRHVRQKSPSPIRSVKMSPPPVRRNLQRNTSPMTNVRSVKAPSLKPQVVKSPKSPVQPTPSIASEYGEPGNIREVSSQRSTQAQVKQTRERVSSSEMKQESVVREQKSVITSSHTHESMTSSVHYREMTSSTSSKVQKVAQSHHQISQSQNHSMSSSKMSSSNVTSSTNGMSLSSGSSSSLDKPPASKRPYVAPVQEIGDLPSSVTKMGEVREITGVRKVIPSFAKKSQQKEVAVFPPFIKTGMCDVEVIEGEISLLQCEIIGNPAPTINWYREDAKIESSHDFEISFDGHMSSLLIRETFVDDAGKFTCTAVNEAGTTSSSCYLKVKEPVQVKMDKTVDPSASETELSMTDLEGFESTEAELDFVSGISEAELTDTEIFKPKGGVAQLPNEQQAIAAAQAMLSPVVEEASIASGISPDKRQPSVGASSTPVYTGEPPKFVRTPASMMKLVEGGAVKFECVISGSPPPQVAWAKNGMMLQDGYRFKIVNDRVNNLYSLTIGMVFTEDVGEYTITATNQFGFVSGSVVLMAEENYQLMEEQERLSRQQHEPAPSPRQQESPTPYYKLPPRGRGESRGRGERRVPVSPTTRGPGDLRRTSQSPNQRLRNISRSPVRQMSPGRRIDDVDQLDIEKYFKPKFLKKPLDCECNEGKAIRIDCKVTGRPLPDVAFFRNGGQLYEDYSHRVVVKEDGVRSLIISPAQAQDSGEYTVVAQSVAGKAVTTVKLTVIPDEGVERPRILEKPQSVSVKEGDMVRLEVFAVGRPTPEIVWLKDNSLLVPEKHRDLRIEGVDGHGLLTIEQTNKGLHDAWYTATAVNKVGRDLSRCKVNVERTESEPAPDRKLYIPKATKKVTAPGVIHERLDLRKLDNFDEGDLYETNSMQKPRFKKKLVSVKQRILGSVHFECHVVPIGDPNMKVEWLLDGKELEYANRIMTIFEFGYAALDISAVYPRDTGVISCRATNAHGQAQTSCTLIVKEEKGLVDHTQLPDASRLEKINTTERQRQELSLAHDSHDQTEEEFKSPPKVVLAPDPIRVREGEPARFRCRVVGSPAPKVDWHLNGQAIRQSKRFRIWCDGIHYFEITGVRGYDHGEVRMVAYNSEGREEITTKIEIYQAQDFRTMLHKPDLKPGVVEEKVDMTTLKQYRITRNVEDQFREEKGRHMVSLREVEKPITGLKKLKKVERDEELSSKFNKLSEEERMINTLEGTKKKPDVTSDMEAPVVIERVHNLTVDEGKDARFRVRFHAKPEPEISWFKNEIIIERSDRISWFYPEDNVCELFIRDVTTSDSGSISVRISNPAGQAGSQGFLLVQEATETFYFSEHLSDQTAKENSKSVIFECGLSEGCSEVQWLCNNSIIANGGKYQIHNEGLHLYLRVSEVRLSDQGAYSCRAVNFEGRTIETSSNLIVEAVPKKILSELTNQDVNEGSMCQFAVTVSHDDVRGEWYKDGVAIKESTKHHTEVNGNKRVLVIENVRSDDVGSYKFKYDDQTATAELSMKAMSVDILKQLRDQEVFAGDAVTFQVQLSAYNAIGTWSHDGAEVSSSERVIVTTDRQKHMLIIENCMTSDSGEYNFQVSDNNTSARLTVKDVVVQNGLRDVTVLESDQAILECELNQPDYKSGTWLFNGVETEKFETETDGAIQRLIIPSASPQDGGLFRYVTGNNSSTEASLSVKEVEIVEQLQDIVESETAPVQLEVQLSEDGAKGQWSHNGNDIGVSLEIDIDQVSDSLGEALFLH